MPDPLQCLVIEMCLSVREELLDRLQDIEENLDVGHCLPSGEYLEFTQCYCDLRLVVIVGKLISILGM